MFSLVHALFGCTHKRFTFPRSALWSRAGEAGGAETYVECLRCGREFPYDWNQMKVVDTRKGYALAPRSHEQRPNAV